MAKWQRNKDPERWLLYNRNGKAPSSATAAVLKAEVEGRIPIQGSSHVHTASRSLGPGGRRLRTVDKGTAALFGDEDEDEEVKPKHKRNEAEGDVDEMIFEEDFDDDDERVEEDNEEAKETEVRSLSPICSSAHSLSMCTQERLKREYKVANKQRDGHVVESDEEEEQSQLTKDGKAIKKLIRNLEKNTAYDSDEEKNPYASSVRVV
jgi:transcription initiation factor TFIIF subunit alpha